MGKPELPSAASSDRSADDLGESRAAIDVLRPGTPALSPAPPAAGGPNEDEDEDEDDSLGTIDVPSARSQSVDGIFVPSPSAPDGIPSNPAPALAAKSGSLRGLSGNPAGKPEEPNAVGEFPVSNWDRYEFLSLLGQGGMGAVYKARDRRLRRIVALKFIRGGDDRLTQRFMQEARAQSRIDHPGVCKVLEVGDVEGKFYIAMQYVDGPSLQQAKAELTLNEKVLIIKEAAEALHAAHELGIVHREPTVPSRSGFLFSEPVETLRKAPPALLPLPAPCPQHDRSGELSSPSCYRGASSAPPAALRCGWLARGRLPVSAAG